VPISPSTQDEGRGPGGGAATARERVVVLVKLPDIPVMVTVADPVVAVPLAVRVKVLLLAVLARLNEAVTPLGKPDADKLTFPLKPFCGVTVTVVVPMVPCTRVKVLGDADSAKFGFGATFTVKESVVVLLKLPEVPLIVTVLVPVAAVLVAVSVSVLVPAVLAGLNTALTPDGRPDADKLTLPLNPFCGVTVIVVVPLVPCVITTEAGDAIRVKFGAGGGGVLTDTLSKVALAREVVLPLLTASPIYTFCPMVTVCAAPTCVQFTPSGDA